MTLLGTLQSTLDLQAWADLAMNADLAVHTPVGIQVPYGNPMPYLSHAALPPGMPGLVHASFVHPRIDTSRAVPGSLAHLGVMQHMQYATMPPRSEAMTNLIRPQTTVIEAGAAAVVPSPQVVPATASPSLSAPAGPGMALNERPITVLGGDSTVVPNPTTILGKREFPVADGDMAPATVVSISQ